MSTSKHRAFKPPKEFPLLLKVKCAEPSPHFPTSPKYHHSTRPPSLSCPAIFLHQHSTWLPFLSCLSIRTKGLDQNISQNCTTCAAAGRAEIGTKLQISAPENWKGENRISAHAHTAVSFKDCRLQGRLNHGPKWSGRFLRGHSIEESPPGGEVSMFHYQVARFYAPISRWRFSSF